MYSGNAIQLDCTQCGIDGEFHELCTISVDCIGSALTLFIQWLGWRVITFFRHDNVAKLVRFELRQINYCSLRMILQLDVRPDKLYACITADIAHAQQVCTQCLCRKFGSHTGNISLARGRCFAAVRREVRITGDQFNTMDRYTECIGRDLCNNSI